MKVGTTLRNSQAQAILDAIAAGVVNVYNGTEPATPQTALSGNTLLASFVLDNPAGTKSSGVITLTADVQDSSADASGTPTFVRVMDSTNVTCHLQMTAAVGSGEWNFTTALTTGQIVPLSSGSITVPAS